MNKTTATYYLTTVIIAMQIISGILIADSLDKDEGYQIAMTNMYMLMQAISWVFAFTIIAMLTTGLFKQLMWIVVILWLGKVADELFYDPTVLQWNDLFNFFVGENLAIAAVVRHLTKRNQK